MNEQKLRKMIGEGLAEDGHTALENGAVWETFQLEDVVVQAPEMGREGDVLKNSFMYEHLAENGVKVPEVVFFQEEAPAYAVYENIEGESLDQIMGDVSDEEYLDTVEKTGELLGRIHTTDGFGYGWPDSEQNFRAGTHSTWREFVRDRKDGIQERVDEWPFNIVVDRAVNHLEIEDIPEKTESAVLHRDFHSQNLIVDGEEVYVLDLDNSAYGDPRFDFVYSSSQITGGNPELEESFLEGYESVRDLGMDDTLKDNYVALSVLQSAEAGYWNQQKEHDIDMKSWVESLHKWMDFQYE